MNDESKIGYSSLRNKYRVCFRQYTKKNKTNWVGTQILFSGKNAVYFYKRLKTQKLDWSLFKLDRHSLSFGRIDLCFSRTNDSNSTTRSFDVF